jgi:hypothetical protein
MLHENEGISIMEHPCERCADQLHQSHACIWQAAVNTSRHIMPHNVTPCSDTEHEVMPQWQQCAAAHRHLSSAQLTCMAIRLRSVNVNNNDMTSSL